MKIEVEVSEAAIEKLVRQRMGWFFGDDFWNRRQIERALVRQIADGAAIEAVKNARARLAVDALIAGVDVGVKIALWTGFDPGKLTEGQQAWLVGQMEKVKDGGESPASKNLNYSVDPGEGRR